jgi:hypothetical protein
MQISSEFAWGKERQAQRRAGKPCRIGRRGKDMAEDRDFDAPHLDLEVLGHTGCVAMR